jgi:hypothetical protein
MIMVEKRFLLLERIAETYGWRLLQFVQDEDGYKSVEDIIEYDDINAIADFADKLYEKNIDLAPIHANVVFDSRVKKIGTKLKKIAEML